MKRGWFLTVWLLSYLSLGYPFIHTNAPTKQTNVYMAVSTLIENQGATDGGWLFATSTTNTTVWQNEIKFNHITSVSTEYVVTPDNLSSNVINTARITLAGSGKEDKAVSAISGEKLEIYYRNPWTFYQLREVQGLSNLYVVVTYHVPGGSNVIYIYGLFQSKISVTFPASVDVMVVAGGIKDVIIDGQKASFGVIRYGLVVKIVADQDLTGTVITNWREKIGVISGSVSTTGSGYNYNMDHLQGTEKLGREYIVFGLPDNSKNHICRIVAVSANTVVSRDGIVLTTLVNKYEFYDITLTGNSFTYISGSSPFGATVILDNSHTASDMIVLAPVETANTTNFNFGVPVLTSDVNVQHYLVVIIQSGTEGGLLLDGEALPSDTVWTKVSGATYMGTYISLQNTSQTHVIRHTGNTAFTTYLLGYATDTVFASLLLPDLGPKQNTSSGSHCMATQGDNNYHTATLSIKKQRRYMSFNIVTMKTPSLQACQLMCYMYENCVGINYSDTEIDVNCDTIMSGSINIFKFTEWNTYLFK